MAKSKPQSPQSKVGFWHMWRDVLVTSMNKGQFPVALVGMIFLVMIIKMPGADVSKLVFQIFADVKAGWLAGYAGCFGLVVAWFLHSKRQRRISASELRRISAERNRLQADATGLNLTSSDTIK